MPPPLLSGILVALIWGVQPVISRYGLQQGLTPLDATLMRFLTSGLLILPFAWRRGLWQRDTRCGTMAKALVGA